MPCHAILTYACTGALGRRLHRLRVHPLLQPTRALNRHLHRPRVRLLHQLQRAGADAGGLAQHDARGGGGERVDVAVQRGVHQEARGCTKRSGVGCTCELFVSVCV